MKIEDCIIKSSTSHKPLGVIIDNKLNFAEHVSKLCKKASQKLMLLQEFQVTNAFFSSQFAYCLGCFTIDL